MTLFAFAAMIFGCNPSETETPEPPAGENHVEAPAPASAEPTKASTADVDWSAALTDPSLAIAEAPATYKVKVETTEGDFVVEVHRDWAPIGADRFFNLVKAGYFDDIAFFRTVPGFMAQFGIHGDPAVNRAWRPATLKDEPVKQSNTRGRVTFAKTNFPNSRTTQLFINYVDNSRLDGMGFAPFGEVVEGMEVVEALHKTGEGFPMGQGPNQSLIHQQGNDYLREKFPEIDYIKSAKVID